MRPQVAVFTDLQQASNTERKNLSPILDFHFAGSASGAIETADANPRSPLRITPDPGEADYFVLPMHWTCYLWNGKRDLPKAMQMADLAARYGKPLIIWFKGDLVPRIPFDNYLLFLPGIIRSSQKENHIACPVFVDDPQPKYGDPATLWRQKNGTPTVGFCGYASSSALKTAWSIVNGVGLKLVEKLGGGDYEAIPILPSTFLRSRALGSSEDSSRVATDYVVRQNYTPPPNAAGRRNGDDRLTEFFANVYGTDYTICLRGYGNWSYRFYETLACGRVPVFIDTDCRLPLDDVIDWKKYCVWVDRSEVPLLGEKIADFHANLSPSEFVDLQKACRQLWEERLTPTGFINDLHLYLR